MLRVGASKLAILILKYHKIHKCGKTPLYKLVLLVKYCCSIWHFIVNVTEYPATMHLSTKLKNSQSHHTVIKIPITINPVISSFHIMDLTKSSFGLSFLVDESYTAVMKHISRTLTSLSYDYRYLF